MTSGSSALLSANQERLLVEAQPAHKQTIDRMQKHTRTDNTPQLWWFLMSNHWNGGSAGGGLVNYET